MQVQSCCFALSSYCLFDFLVAAATNKLPINYDTLWSIKNRIFCLYHCIILNCKCNRLPFKRKLVIIKQYIAGLVNSFSVMSSITTVFQHDELMHVCKTFDLGGWIEGQPIIIWEICMVY